VYGVLLLAAVLPAAAVRDAGHLVQGCRGDPHGHLLLALPTSLNWSTAWATGLVQACTGVDCRGLQPFFWNSVAMAVPAVLISTAWGALNGYVLSLWKFAAARLLFGCCCLACSCRCRWCCCR
jgi:glucose/mannose transport system permease protein